MNKLPPWVALLIGISIGVGGGWFATTQYNKARTLETQLKIFVADGKASNEIALQTDDATEDVLETNRNVDSSDAPCLRSDIPMELLYNESGRERTIIDGALYFIATD